MKTIAWTALLLLAGFASRLSAQAPAAPDYAQPSAWVCRPGVESICTAGLDATVIAADGKSSIEHFQPAANPPVDCFYVYPTVSREPTPYADLTDSPEIQRVVNAQAGRFTSRCRVFAPLYRQATLAHLRQRLAGGEARIEPFPANDLLAAWKYYLQHDNHGRGVVLIGHSQGTILLQALMASEIDGTPAQALLVSAFLAGDPSLGVPAGSRVGGTFRHIPVCAAAAETGCVYAWGSFREGDAGPQQTFGKARKDGLLSACVNPAAPGGGVGLLKLFYPRRDASPGEPLWIEGIGQLTGACHSDANGNAFYVSVAPSPAAPVYQALLSKADSRPGWGLHILDISLVQGNMLDVLDAEIVTWKKSHP